MLTRILKFVDTQNLLKCRLVSRNWSSLSSGILFNRPKIDFIPFSHQENRGFSCVRRDPGQSSFSFRPLQHFLQCMKRSKNCPYSHFAFVIIGNSSPTEFFNDKYFKEFLVDFAPPNSSQNPRIKGLHFATSRMKSMPKFQMFVEKVGDFLQNKIPPLERLFLNFQDSVEAPQLKLFSTPKETKTVVPVELPHLKAVQFGDEMISAYTQIVKDLLNAAVNLTWLRVSPTKFQDFQFLHSLGKLHLLKEVEIELDQEFFSVNKSDKNCSLFPLPKLDFLHFMMSNTKKDENFNNQATKFLGNLFESSKDTLDLLAVQPFGFLSSLKLPTFKNLKTLNIRPYVHKHGSSGLFPSGIRSRNVFPAVVEIELDNISDWSDAFPQPDSIPILPSLTSLSLKDQEIDDDAISILALMCPNLKKFKIYRNDENDNYNDPDDDPDDIIDISPQLDFLKVGRAIWTHMKQLESLEVDISFYASKHAVESCFTGISEENCRRLINLAESIKKSEKGKRHGKIDESQYERLAVREFPSILEMKDLMTLTVNPYDGKELLDKKKFLTEKLTWISQSYAFDLMPQLKVNED